MVPSAHNFWYIFPLTISPQLLQHIPIAIQILTFVLWSEYSSQSSALQMIYFVDDLTESIKFYHSILKKNGSLVIIIEKSKAPSNCHVSPLVVFIFILFVNVIASSISATQAKKYSGFKINLKKRKKMKKRDTILAQKQMNQHTSTTFLMHSCLLLGQKNKRVILNMLLLML